MADLLRAEDLRNLPLRAIIAFAARCARRVQPLYDLPENEKDKHRHIAALDDAVEIAERFARDASDANAAAATYAARAADAAAQAAARAYAARAATDADTYATYAACASRVSHAARVAAAAAYAARDAAEARAAGESDFAVAALAADNAAAAVADATVAENVAGIDGTDNARALEVQTAAHFDYERLAALDLGRYPELGKPIDATEAGPLGPLWQGEPPAWYTEGISRMRAFRSSAPTQIISASASAIGEGKAKGKGLVSSPDECETTEPPILEIYIDPGNASKETIQDVLEALSNLQINAGGLGLEFKVDGNTVLASQEVSR